MFCSTSITVHLLRGVAAAVLLLAALWGDSVPLAARWAAGAGAVLLLRGCPMCWLMGLFETAARRRPAPPPLQ